MTKDGMQLYVTWVKGGREWCNLENVKTDAPNLVKQYMEKKINDQGRRILKKSKNMSTQQETKSSKYSIKTK